jgi:hypothetical protein
MSEDNTAPPGLSTEYAPTWVSSIVSVAIIAIVIVIGFEAYTIYHRDYLSAQANSWARTFIRSSPVVEQQLGRVQTVKQISEEHLSGKSPGWYLDYDVTGRDGMGVVDMRLNPSQYDSWSVPSAELNEGHRKPVNLR